MTREIDLTYSGSQTYSPAEFDNLKLALDGLTQTHQSDQSDIRVPSGSLRWRDGLWVSVTLEITTAAADIATAEDNLAQAIVDAGFEPDLAAAKEEINVA